ncbi:hypothetical protein ANN_08294, partial [Periplaneta americana]
KPEEDATFHDNSYGYKVRVKREDAVIEVPVCSKAFVSVHGITKKRREVIQRTTYNGAWEESVVNSPGSLPQDASSHCREFILPEKTYKGPLPVSKEKYNDLQELIKFCGEEARGFYEKLPRKD